MKDWLKDCVRMCERYPGYRAVLLTSNGHRSSNMCQDIYDSLRQHKVTCSYIISERRFLIRHGSLRVAHDPSRLVGYMVDAAYATEDTSVSDRHNVQYLIRPRDYFGIDAIPYDRVDAVRHERIIFI